MDYLYSAMLSKIIQKLLSGILSIWIISMLIFFFSKAVPGDQIRDLLAINHDSAYELDFRKEYINKAREFNFDKPLFYFSVLPSNFPKNINKHLLLEQKRWLKNFLFKGYNYEDLENVINQIDDFFKRSSKEDIIFFEKEISILFNSENKEELNRAIEKIKSKQNEATKDSTLMQTMLHIDKVDFRKSSSFLIPKIRVHGFNNQYHIWISNLLKGNPGVSNIDKRPVLTKINRALAWTIFLVLFSLILSYGFGILMGLFLAGLKNKRIVKIIENILFGIYAIPIFWLATLLLVFFTTNEYGWMTNIFPSVGLVPIDMGEPWFVRISNYGRQLILPCFCLVIHNMAFIGSLTKRNINARKKEGFVLTARAFGYTDKEILFREIFPHTLLPIITSITSAIPAALGGSLVLEIIFNIPGMGRLLFNSIKFYDWPVVFTIVLFIAGITIVSFLLADILYRFIDPRIKSKQDV